MQFQLGDQQMSNLTQSAQRAHELELASKLVKNLQNLYTMNDQELDQAVQLMGLQNKDDTKQTIA
jgi:hypothetical protein